MAEWIVLTAIFSGKYLSFSNYATLIVYYTICGYIMLGCLGLLILFFLWPDSIAEDLVKFKPVFWLETIAFIAFGFSWLVKGGFLFKDKA